MNLVGQQELMAPPQRRRIIAAHGGWWGVDSSTSRVAIATISPGGQRGVTEVAFSKRLSGAARLSAIYHDTLAAAQELAGLVPPGIVLIEQAAAPKERSLNRALEQAIGVIQVGVYDGCMQTLGCGVEMESFPASWWKVRACGRGNIYKPTVKALGRKPVPEDYGVLTWAWESGMPRSVVSWDSADAWGMAEAIKREVAIEVRT